MNALRAALQQARGLRYVGAPAPLYAKLIERHGFDGVYLSGAGVANSAYGIPDNGTLTLEQLLPVARATCQATRLPVICDADTGFADDGEEWDVGPCVRALQEAGVAAIQIEDQVSAKKCGHLEGKQLVPQALMVRKIQTAVVSRRNADLVLIARTDARAVTGWDDALARAKAYRAAGADMIFIEALPSAGEFQRFAEACPGPLLANMTEFGKSPLLPCEDLAQAGYTVVIYPMTLTRLMLATADAALVTLRAQGHQRNLVPAMYTRQQLYDLLEYDEPVPQPPAGNE
ncbi:MAG TPA: isocitrate lyase/phosphoenolpyruvate mutase family protein [bacterium]|nr:isocitrate lyase/phosphoenolpyruvate mutase family protein [bacterium]